RTGWWLWSRSGNRRHRSTPSPAAWRLLWCSRLPDIEIKAVFGRRRLAVRPWRAGRPRILHAVMAELVGDQGAAPWLRRLRRAPAQIADRRRGERDAPVMQHI